jgi:ligand-binding sensor domain-containing protein/signal transduction histidine kinase
MNINHKIILALFLLYCASFAQKKDDSFFPWKEEEVDFRVVESKENHPPFLIINSLIQTNDGFIWLGTRIGLFRYDGVRFVLFNKENTSEFSNNMVNTLYEDYNKTLWIGTNGGLISYKNGKFNKPDAKFDLDSKQISSITGGKDNSILFSVNGSGIFKIKDGITSPVFQLDGLRPNTITMDLEGSIWFGTPDTGLFRIKNNEIIHYSTENELTSNTIRDLFCDKKGRLWIGTWGGGLLQYSDNKFTSYNDKINIPDNVILSICEDKSGAIWIGTSGDGLIRYENDKFTIYTIKDGLSNDAIKSLMEDREGNLWIGTFDGELNRMTTKKITTFTKKDGISNNFIWTIGADKKNRLYIGTNGGGVDILSKNGKTNINKQNGLSNNLVRSVYNDKAGNLWIGTSKGLNIHKNGKNIIHSYKNGFCDDLVKAIFEDSEGNMWIGTRTGLAWFKKGEIYKYNIIEEFNTLDIRYITEDKFKNIWVGTNSGLFEFTQNKTILKYDTSNGLSGRIIYSLYYDNENIMWITSNKGLDLLIDGKFIGTGKTEPLLNQVIYSLIEDNYGNVWMSTNFGILCANKKELLQYYEGKIQRAEILNYNKKDGMLTTECNGGNQPSGYKLESGIILFPTMNGVAYIDPSTVKFKRNKLPPPVVISSLIVNNKNFLPADGLQIEAGSDRFEFFFSALSFSDPEKNQYKYKLEGFDKDFIYAGNKSSAQYTNIAPGSYKFIVLASNNDEVWNIEGASFSFTLRPYFYQATWFYFLCGFIILASGFLINLYKEKRYKKNQMELEALINERTGQLQEVIATKDKLFSIIAHDLKSPMNTLALTLEMLVDDFTDISPENLQEFLKDTRNNSQNIIHLLENLLRWAGSQRNGIEFKPEIIPLGKVINEIVNLLQQPAKNKSIKISSDIGNEIDACFDRDMISTVIRNLLSNAIKYSNSGGEIKITVVSKPDCREITISDNGAGISEENLRKIFSRNKYYSTRGTAGEKGTGLGLKLCKELVEKNNGRLWVRSEQGRGSEFSFSLPVKKTGNNINKSDEIK